MVKRISGEVEKCCVVLPKNTQRAIIEIHLITLNVRKGTVTAMINSKRKNEIREVAETVKTIIGSLLIKKNLSVIPAVFNYRFPKK